MQKINILSAGKLSKKYYAGAADEYKKRLSAMCKLGCITIKERGETATDLQREADDFRSQLPKKAYVVAMCVEGKQSDSKQIADLLSTAAHSGKELCFIIGSSAGLCDTLKKESDLCLSLSKLTLPHQLAQVVLLEQIYRGFTINSGTPYHK